METSVERDDKLRIIHVFENCREWSLSYDEPVPYTDLYSEDRLGQKFINAEFATNEQIVQYVFQVPLTISMSLKKADRKRFEKWLQSFKTSKTRKLRELAAAKIMAFISRAGCLKYSCWDDLSNSKRGVYLLNIHQEEP